MADKKLELLARVSHELRTPLHSIAGMTSLLETTELSEEQKQYLETIQASSEALLGIVEELLNYTRVNSGEIVIEHVPFSLSMLAQTTSQIVSASSGLNVEVEVCSELGGIVVGDANRFRQVLLSLLHYASKTATNKEAKLGMRKAAELPDSSVDVSFKILFDSPSLNDEQLDSLFELNTAESLALVTAKTLVTALGGKIWAEQGALCFQAPVETAFGESSKISCVQRLLNSKILILDKREVALKTNQAIFQPWTSAIKPCLDFTEAMKLVSGSKFDLALIDYDMPGENGLEIVKELRKSAKNASLPVILLTAEEVKTNDPLIWTTPKPPKRALVLETIEKIFKSSSRQTLVQTEGINQEFASKHPLKILIAEDNDVNLKIIVRVLEKLGYKPAVARNGLEATEATQSESFDFILMDMEMPEMDGLQATSIIRKEKGEQPFIVALTANAFEADKQACTEAGMNSFLSKPMKIRDLMLTLEQASGQNKP